MARDSSAAGHGVTCAGSKFAVRSSYTMKCAGVGLRSGRWFAATRHHAPHFQHGGSMLRRFALGVLGAFTLVFALAAVSLAGSSQANAPPQTVTPTPATSLMLPAVTVKIPDVGYVHPVPLRITPIPVLPAATTAAIAPVKRSSISPLAKRPPVKPRLRDKPKAGNELRLPHNALALKAGTGGRGFL
jgi:hypothetical protein